MRVVACAVSQRPPPESRSGESPDQSASPNCALAPLPGAHTRPSCVAAQPAAYRLGCPKNVLPAHGSLPHARDEHQLPDARLSCHASPPPKYETRLRPREVGPGGSSVGRHPASARFDPRRASSSQSRSELAGALSSLAGALSHCQLGRDRSLVVFTLCMLLGKLSGPLKSVGHPQVKSGQVGSLGPPR